MSLSRRALLLAAGTVPTIAYRAARAAEPAGIACPLAKAPGVLVPGVSDAPETRLVGSKIYRGLCRIDLRGIPQPDLAAAWEVSPDGLTYTFHLLPGLIWHDSGALTADDVVFSIDRFHRQLQPLLGLGRVQSVRAPDARTVVMTLAAAYEPFLRQMDALCTPIVPRHVHDVPGWALDPRQVRPVGAGPFRVAEWLRLVRFDWFVGPKPALAEISYPIVADPAARLALLDAGCALLVGDAVDPAALPNLRQSPALAVEGEAPEAIAGLRLNRAAKPLDDRRVRLALAQAVDRAAILRDAWLGLGQVASGPVLASQAGASALPAYDPRAASVNLTQAGFRPDDTGIRLRLTHLVPPGWVWRRLAGSLQLRLQQVGVDLALENVSAAEWARRVAAGDYQTTGFVTPQTGDLARDLATYLPDQPAIAPMLSGDMGALAQAQAMLLSDVTRLWLVEPAIPVVRDRRLHLPGGVFDNFAGASLS